VLAEGLAGSEDAFAQRMTERARELGMNESTFANATGWPHPNHRMSARDLITLSRRMIEQFPEYYHYFAETDFTWDKVAQRNRNPLLYLDIGADGLKTGHTEEAGYGLVGSAVQGDRRIVFVFTGLQSNAERRQEAEAMINWGFRQFLSKTVAETGDVVSEVPVWLGDHQRINVIAGEDIELLIPATAQESVETRIEYRSPLEAPIAVGDPVADLVVTAQDMPERRIPLVADRDVVRGGFLPRVRASASVLFDKAMGQVQTLLE